MKTRALRSRVYGLLHPIHSGSHTARIIELALMLLIFVNIVAIILESVPRLNASYWQAFLYIEIISVLIFTVEYLLRIWSSTENPKYADPVSGRLRYMLSTPLLIDLFAILPFYLAFLPIDLRFIRIIRLFRLFRLLKIARYLKALNLIRDVLHEKKEQIYVSVMFIAFLLIIVSTIMFYVENKAQPDVFTSIPASMWWGIETLTTVGYGDMLPVTPLGRLLGGMISVLGIGLFALPAGILSSGLTEHMQKNDKHKTKKCPHCGGDI
jgi:voltage-gated potassium channel